MTKVRDRKSEGSQTSALSTLLFALSFLAALFLVLSVSAEAQPKKVPRIGVLWPTAPPDPFFDAFKQGLRELGYIQGQNIGFEERWAEGKPEQLPTFAAELVRLGVDV